MTSPRYQTAADLFARWHEDVVSGKAPVLYPIGNGELARIDVGPKLVTLVGGAPGSGKTALTMQWAVDALRLTESLRVLVCNIEMPPEVLLDRQLARLSGIDATLIRQRHLGEEHAERLALAMDSIENIADRLCIVRPPFDLQNVAECADEFGASLLVLDYIQRIPPPGQQADRRQSVDATMGYLRKFADEGMAVIVVAAVARSKDAKGRSSYSGEGLSLASYRESSELEFGADDAFILVQHAKDPGCVVLRHLKSRHGEARDLELQFDGARQSFTSRSDAHRIQTAPFRVSEDVARIWDEAEPTCGRGLEDAP